MFTIDVKAFVASLLAAQKNFARSVLKAVQRAAELASDRARGTYLFRDNTGELRKSITARTEGGAGLVFATAHHAAWIERGNTFRTGAAYIYPTSKPMLVFQVGGHKVVARRVKASAPRPFMADAREATVPLFEDLCQQAVSTMFTQ